MSGGRSELHPLESLSLVGPDRAVQFRALGIGSVEELVALGGPRAKEIATAVDGLSQAQFVELLLPEAWFSLLGDLGERGAAALVKAGITSYISLTDAPAGRIASALSSLKPSPDAHECALFQLAAAKAMLTYRVLFQVRNGSSPTPKPEVTVGGAGFDTSSRPVTVTGDREGWVLTPPLRRDRSHLVAVKGGRHIHSLVVTATSAAPIQTAFLSFSSPPKPAVRDQPGDPVRMFSGWETQVTRSVATTKRLKAGTPLIVSAPNEEGSYVLSSALREYQGGITLVTTVEVEKSALPSRVVAGDVVIVGSDGRLKKATSPQRRKILSARRSLQQPKAATR